MTRVIGPPRSKRRRRTFICCLLVSLGVGMLFISGALAVAPEANPPGYMELDKDAIHNQTALHMGTLKSSASATDTSIHGESSPRTCSCPPSITCKKT